MGRFFCIMGGVIIGLSITSLDWEYIFMCCIGVLFQSIGIIMSADVYMSDD